MNSPMATLSYGDTSGVAMGLLIRGFEKLYFFKKFFKIFLPFKTRIAFNPKHVRL